jgi:hypothetical protein
MSFLRGFCSVWLLTVFVAATAFAAPTDTAPEFSSDVTTDAKPWTHLNFQNNPDNFQFAVVTDRTGGPRPGVFEDAVKKLNWLMPEFVVSVGDLIKGTGANGSVTRKQWDEFMGFVKPLKMPFFFVPGNHDIQMKWLENRVQPEEMLAQWHERFGPTHYSFVYKNVLFVALFSNDGKEQNIGDEQAAYFEKVIAQHPDVRWTFVVLHHPLWAYPQESNFDRVEAALAGRKYTVLAGHHHRYVHFDRNNTNYYILASTGGSSRLRGNAFGEFDHVAWFTMTDDGPVMANLRLDGILPHNVSQPGSLGLVRGLDQSSEVGTSVILDSGPDGNVRAGSVFVTFQNVSDHPLRIDGEFAHNHLVYPRPGVITRVLPPHTSEVAEVDLQIMSPFKETDGSFLELRTVMSLGEVDVPGLQINQTTVLPLRLHRPDVFETESIEFAGSTEVAPHSDRDERDVRFTTDGTDPTAASPRFNRSHVVTADAVLKARVFTRTGVAGPVDALALRKIPAGQGLMALYYEHDNSEGHVNRMPVFPGLPPTLVRRVSNFDLAQIARREEDFAIVFHGNIEIGTAGNYGFHVDSADGAELLIDGEVVISDAIKHGRHEASGFAQLTAGRHAIELHFFQANRDSFLSVQFTPPGGKKQTIPDSVLSFDADSKPVLAVPVIEGEPE